MPITEDLRVTQLPVEVLRTADPADVSVTQLPVEVLTTAALGELTVTQLPVEVLVAAPPTRFKTSFTEYDIDEVPGDWTPSDGNISAKIIAGNGIIPGGNLFEITNSAAANHTLTWERPTSAADSETLVLWTHTAAGGYYPFGPIVRHGPGVRGYTILTELESSSKWYTNVYTSVSSGATLVQGICDLYPDQEWIWSRIRVEGTAISSKIWPATAPEPPEWMYSGTDGTIVDAGKVGIFSYQTTDKALIAYFVCHIDGTSPALPICTLTPVVTPAIYWTDFTEYTPGPGLPADWSNWVGTASIEAGDSPIGGNRLVNAATTYEFMWWNVTPSDAYDVEVLSLSRCRAHTTSYRGTGFYARYNARNPPYDTHWSGGYIYRYNKGQVYVNGRAENSSEILPTLSSTLNLRDWNYIRYRVIGNTYMLRIWKYGTTEPTSWHTIGTNLVQRGGYVGLSSSDSWPSPYEFAYYAVATGGLTAPLPQPQFITDFSEYTIGQAPPDWSGAPWGTDSTMNILADPDGLGLGGKILEISRASGEDYRAVSWDVVGSYEDVEVLTLVSVNAQSGLFIRAQNPYKTAYNFIINNTSGSQTVLTGHIGNTYTGVIANVLCDVGPLNSWAWLRFKISGSLLRGKVWSFGTVEPPTWTFEKTHTSITTAGLVGLHSYSSTTSPKYCAYFAVVPNGGASPTVPNAPVPTPQILSTNFSEYTTGVEPTGWTKTWSTTQNATIIESPNEAVDGGKLLKIDRTSRTNALYTWDALDAIPHNRDFEALILWKSSNSNHYGVGIGGRYFDANNLVRFYPYDKDRLFFNGTGQGNNRGSEGPSPGSSQMEWSWLRGKIEGTVLFYKHWRIGEPEPAEWTSSTTLGDTASPNKDGKIGIWTYETSADPFYISYFSVGLGGLSPSIPTSVSAERRVNTTYLETLAKDTYKESRGNTAYLEVLVEVPPSIPLETLRNTLTNAQVLVGSADGVSATLRNTLTNAQVLVGSSDGKAIVRNTLLNAQVLLGNPVWAPIEEDPIINGAGLGMPGEATTVYVDYFALSAGEEAQTQPPTFFTDPASYSYRFGITNSNFNSSEKELIHLGLVKYSVKLWYSQRRGYTNSTYGSYIALLKGDTELGEWFEEAVWDDRRPTPVTDYDWHWAGIENEPWPRDFFGVWAGHMLYGPGIAAGAIDFTLHFPEYDIKVGRSPNLFMRIPRLSYTGVGAGKFYNTSLADGFWRYDPADATKWLGYNTKTSPWPFPHPEGMAIFVPSYPVTGEVKLYRHIDLRTYEFFNEDFVAKALENAATAFFTFNVGSAVGSAGTSTAKAGFIFLDDTDQIVMEDLRDITPSAGSWSTIDFEAIEFPGGVRQILMGYVLPAGTSSDICFGYMELKLGLNGVLLGIVPYPENEFCFNIPYVEDENGNVICNQYEVAFFGEDKTELVYPLQTVTVCPVRPTQPGPPGEPDPPPPPVDLGDPVPLNFTIEVRDGLVYMEADHHPNWTGLSMWYEVMASKETDPYNLTSSKLVHSGWTLEPNPPRAISFHFPVGPYTGFPPDDYFNNWWDYNHWMRYYMGDGSWYGPWTGGVTGSPAALNDPPPGVKYQFIKAIAYFTATSEASAVRLTWTTPENISDYAISRVYYSRNSKEPQLLTEVFNSEYLHIHFSRQPTRFFYWVAYVSTQGVEGPRAGPIEGLTGRAEDFEDINRIDRKYWSVSDPLPVANWDSDHYDDISNISSAGLYYAEAITDPPDVEQHSYYGKGCIALQASDTVDVSISLKKTIRLGDTSYLLVSFAVMHGFAIADADIIDISLVTDQGEITALRTAYWQGSAWQPLQTPPEYGEWIVGYSVFNVRTGDDLVPDPQIAGLKISLNPSAADEWLFIDGLSVFKTYGEYAEPPTPDKYIDPPGSTQITVLNADKYIKPGAINTQHLADNSVSQCVSVTTVGPIALSTTDPVTIATLILDISGVNSSSCVIVNASATTQLLDSPVQLENVTIDLLRDVDGGGFSVVSSKTIYKEGKLSGTNYDAIGHDMIILIDPSPVNGVVTYKVDIAASYLSSAAYITAVAEVSKR